MSSVDVQAVVECELALLSLSVRRTQRLVDELLDPDFQEIGASGRLWNRADISAALAAEGSDQTPHSGHGGVIEASEMTSRVLAADLVLLTYVSLRHGRPPRRARRTSLWRLSPEGSWRLLHHQGTLLADELAEPGLPFGGSSPL
ncbi:hypothetical protein SAMN05892883_2038 [Jatrophihabitans sp. GAS493]|uniref:nuclear transport factor 2 family protein n=1 Tax=Jatrophihabitans sp. GAS493 TaxID=1907575 RepID=UPI000BB7E7F5|nr:DUF4440 domain-containing protein [Jatrophihabitans sp. GAS493]SOD72684.1 hypothetical protein SAMN05892883_2038 [Jatrophihabitans sp. GAS493]